jgi:hypothetical protein
VSKIAATETAESLIFVEVVTMKKKYRKRLPYLIEPGNCGVNRRQERTTAICESLAVFISGVVCGMAAICLWGFK